MKAEYTPAENYVMISLEQGKRQLRLEADYTAEDDQIQDDIDAAISAAETYTQRELLDQVLTLTLDAFEAKVCFNEWRKIQKSDIVVSVVLAGDTERTTVPETDYTLVKIDGFYGITFLNEMVLEPVDDAMVITVQCLMSKDIRKACLLKLSEFYEIRENRAANNNNVFEQLLRPFRKWY